MGGVCVMAGQWAASCRIKFTASLRPGSILFGQLLLDVEQELVVRKRRFRAVLNQVLEETALCRRVVSEQRENGGGGRELDMLKIMSPADSVLTVENTVMY